MVPALVLSLCIVGSPVPARSAPSLFPVMAHSQWRRLWPAGGTVHALAVGHKDATLVVAGTEKGVYRRERGGHWHSILGVPVVWSAVVAKDDTIVAGDNDGDVYVGSQSGKSWRHTTVTPLGVFAVAVEPGSTTHMLSGTGDGIYLSRDAGRHWQRRLTLSNSGVSAIVWQPGRPRLVLAGALARSAQGSTQVYISRDAGRTWHLFGHGLNSNSGVMSLGLTASRVFAGTMGNGVWMAPLATGVWHQMPNGMPASNNHVASITALPGKTHRLIAGTLGYGVFQTNDGGKHWSDLSHDSALMRGGGIVTSLAYARADRGILAGTADGVYELAPSGR